MRSACLWSGALLCSLLLLLGACDTAPGVPTIEGNAPVLSGFAYAPDTLDVAGLGEGAEDGIAEVPLEIEVTARDPEGALRQVGFVVRSPIPGARPLQSGRLQPVEGTADRYRAGTTLRIPIAEVGLYTIRVFALDEEGLLSNEVRGTLSFTARGRRPIIEEVVVPERVQRPSEGETSIAFVAVVSDPDGLANISSVRFWNVTAPDQTFDLRDDGQGGDETAGDGRYTATVTIASTNNPGSNTFAFQATDRSGLTSGVVERTITVE